MVINSLVLGRGRTTMKTVLIYLFVASFYVWCSAKYVVPPSLVEPLKPRGLRVSIPDDDGITLMAFHGNINVPFEGLEAGEMARDIIKKRGDRWVFEDKNIRLKKGDIIYYWIYVILDGLGYQGLDRNHTVTDFISIEETPHILPKPNIGTTCENTITTVRGKSACSRNLIFDSTFTSGTIDTSVWFHERKIGGSDLDDEFVIFDKDNSYIYKDHLVIKPTLTEEKYSEDFVRAGELSIPECTANEEKYCKKRGLIYLILPPVLSSRLSTKHSFSFKYGEIEIKAKLPEGDWIVPELWLEPKLGSSERIVIALVRGNSQLAQDVTDFSSKTMTSGVIFDEDRVQMLRKEIHTPWNRDFHYLRLMWTPNRLTYSVDGQEVGRIDSPNPRENFVPFDKEYFITLGVHVGGVRDFPDTLVKPWKNTEPKRVNNFWSDKNKWLNTWSENSALVVEHVKVWAI